MERKILEQALADTLAEASFEITQIDSSDLWLLTIDGIDVITMPSVRKDYLLRKATSEKKLHEQPLVRSEVEAALRNLLVTPTDLTNTNSVVAELVMGWKRLNDCPDCGCLTYKSGGENNERYVAKDRQQGCANHETWSPLEHLPHTHELFEKTFFCKDGRYLAVTDIDCDLNFKHNPGGPLTIDKTNVVAAKTTIKFRNAGRTEYFEIVDDLHYPPAAVCIAILKLIGLNVVSN